MAREGRQTCAAWTATTRQPHGTGLINKDHLTKKSTLSAQAGQAYLVARAGLYNREPPAYAAPTLLAGR